MMIYIFWSCRNIKEAKQIIYQLLDQRLVACASIFPEVTVLYRWEGNIEESPESKVVLKTLKGHFHAVETHIQAHCSYEIPEIVQIDVAEANSSYLEWLTKETT